MTDIFDRYPLARQAFKAAASDIVHDFHVDASLIGRQVLDIIDTHIDRPTAEKELLAVGTFYRFSPQAFMDDTGSFTQKYGPAYAGLQQELREAFPAEDPASENLRIADTIQMILGLRAGLDMLLNKEKGVNAQQRREIRTFTQRFNDARQPLSGVPALEMLYQNELKGYLRALERARGPKPR